MSSMTFYRIEPPDIYHRLGLAGMSLARSALSIRDALVREGRWDELRSSERGYVLALQEGLREVDALKRHIAAQVAPGEAVYRARPARVADEGIAEVTVGGSTADAHGASREAVASSLAAARDDATTPTVSLAGHLTRQQAPGEALETWVDRERGRLDRLVPVSDAERERVAAARERLERAGSASRDVDEARRATGALVDDLERDLSRGGDERADALATYLALCHVMGERPEPRDYDQLVTEVSRLEGLLAERKMREEVSRKVSAALGRSGLRDRGTLVLDGVEQRLLVEDGELECGLALAEDGTGGFVLTTVTSADPASVSRERRARIDDSARRLCATKRQRLLEELAAEGLVATPCEGSVEDLSRIRYSAELEDVVRSERRGERGRGREEGRAPSMMADD